MHPRIVTALALVSIGCSCGATTTSAPPPPSSTTTPAPDYEVHEWGLVRAEPGDVLRVGAIAPPVDTTPMVVLKPVLYFHTRARATLASVTVTGSIVEAWPPVPVGAQARWAEVTIDPGAACTPSPLPTLTDPFCTALNGDFCETAGLAVARTDDAACVTTGATTERFLFYRGRSTTLTPPLLFESAGASGEVRVTNEGDAAIPGTLVRIWASMGETRARVVAPPGPHASITVASPAATGAALDQPAPSPSLDEARTAVRATITAIGLTEPEADAFVRAWDATLFPAPGTVTATLSLGVPMPSESFVYFLPEPATDAVATLAFDPPPRAVHRAIAVWSMLARTGATH